MHRGALLMYIKGVIRLAKNSTVAAGGSPEGEEARYHSPLDKRYVSDEMNHLFSANQKFTTWHALWVSLARNEAKLGLKQVTPEMVAALEAHVDDPIDYEGAHAYECEVKHDVMAHICAFGDQVPEAREIIHLGATSCFVTDNTDIILMREGLRIIKGKLLGLIRLLSELAEEYKAEPALGYTHLQTATPTTVGKRATLWLQDFVDAFDDIEYVEQRHLKMLGCRGATGSSESFLSLFHGDKKRCRELEAMIAQDFGFVKITETGKTEANIFQVSGQTYPRILDARVLNALSMISTAAYKMAQDIRLLQHDKEIQEPFGTNQVGSSAMAFKRNPMLCERINSLARYMNGQPNIALQTAAVQALERSLDDSAGRRMYLPDSFRLVDAIVRHSQKVIEGLVVNRAIIRRRLDAELPFMMIEDLIMAASECGVDRQKAHEELRQCSLKTQAMAMEEGLLGQEVRQMMLDLIDKSEVIPLSYADAAVLMNPMKLIGCCPEQVDDYLSTTVKPLLSDHKAEIVYDMDISV